MRKILALLAILLAGPALADVTIEGPITFGSGIPIRGATLVTNTAFPSSFSTTPTDYLSINIGSYPTAGEWPFGVFQGIVSSMSVPTTSTSTPFAPNSNFVAHIELKQTAAGATAVNYTGIASINTASTNIYLGNLNLVAVNTDAAHAFSGDMDLGQDFNVIVNMECDPTISHTPGHGTPNGLVDCVRAGGGDTRVIPAGGANAFHVIPLGAAAIPPIPWTCALCIDSGAATGAIGIGALTAAAAANIASQTIQWNYYGGASQALATTLQVGTDQNWTVSVPTGGGVKIAVNSVDTALINSVMRGAGLIVAGSLTQATDTDAIFFAKAAADENLQIRGKQNLGDGIALQSINDALNASKGFEIIASDLRLQVGGINIAGTAAVSCPAGVTAATVVVNFGIVTHC